MGSFKLSIDKRSLGYASVLPILLAVFYIASLFELHLLLLVAIVGIFCTIMFLQSAHVRFIATLAVVVLLQANQLNTTVSYIASFIFTGGFILELVKKKLIQRQPLTRSPLFTWFSVFMVWGALIGLWGVCLGTVELEQWYREVLRWSPLFLLPIYYSEIVEQDPRAEQFLIKCLLGVWLVIFLAEIVKLKDNLTQAIYVFQIGIDRLDPVNGAFMMFVFVSLAMIVGSKKWVYLLSGFLISVLSLLLTFARTSWIATLLVLPIMFFFAKRSERRRGYKFLVLVIIISGLFLVWGYYTIPTVRMGILFISSKFISATKLKTDQSIFGRYIEWDHIFRAILQAPLTGHGTGAKFTNYNWFGGYSFQTAFTHSAYLGILFKHGLIGFILLFIPCVGYFINGVKYMRDPLITEREQAYLRVGVVLMIFMVILGYTGNIFIQREMSVYIALYWCYCIQLEKYLKTRHEKKMGILLTEGS